MVYSLITINVGNDYRENLFLRLVTLPYQEHANNFTNNIVAMLKYYVRKNSQLLVVFDLVGLEHFYNHNHMDLQFCFFM